ncbi:hypothetical protein [Pedobacter sp.]|jgi:hypothetical protein|uniref:hypothetical protein n=1 Tax=Pedobacter sp. TaxID=1411316 RepID=UPI002C8F6F56|nr:hypothetical protein [Pedobacter sp.]HWW40809.1 hypothetical protein [Pedobacter sp.]
MMTKTKRILVAVCCLPLSLFAQRGLDPNGKILGKNLMGEELDKTLSTLIK